ncbi:MAG: FHA domain-containing protein [Acidobacteriota bacterium]
MTDKAPVSKKGFTTDWLMRGALTKIGDTIDRLTGRKWIPSSSLATSELVERIRKLLDDEAKEVPGKGTVVPHNIKLKMQWDKFSTDADGALEKLEYELLAAAADHINDSLYYTYAPLRVEVKPDYFTEGVKLFVSFDKFADDETEAEVQVTVPAINIKNTVAAKPAAPVAAVETFIARFELNGSRRDRRLEFPAGARLSVGRTGGNDLVIDDASVSKIHASLVSDAEGRLSVADTGSTNGTFINDQRIAYGKATHVGGSDKVKFGEIEVVFEHIPRPIEEEVLAENTPDDGAVEMDGFEFKRGSSQEKSPTTEPHKSLPGDTLKVVDVVPDTILQEARNAERAAEKPKETGEATAERKPSE